MPHAARKKLLCIVTKVEASEEIVRRAPDARLETIKAANHMGPVEAHDRYKSIDCRILSGLIALGETDVRFRAAPRRSRTTGSGAQAAMALSRMC